MIRRIGLMWAWAVAAAALASGATVLAQSPARSGAPKAPVKLLPSVTGITPGARFDVALQYDLVDEWHIYWKNPGDSGAPPKVEWKLPPGFSVEGLRFPAPSRHVSGPADFRLTTYVLEGTPALLARITAPPDLKPGTQVTLAAKVTTLVCKDMCLMEQAEVSTTLPAVTAAPEVEPAHAKEFASALENLPKPKGKCRYFKVSATPSVKSVEVGGSLEMEVAIKITAGHKIQSHTPAASFLVPTDVIVEPIKGVEWGQFVFPKPKERMDKVLKLKMSEYTGTAVVRLPITKINDDARGDRLSIKGVVVAQACNKKGQCFPPEAVEWSTTVELTGAQAAELPAADQAGGDAGQAARDPALATVGDSASNDAPGPDSTSLSLPAMLFFAFLGGIILNVMPCVWPVLSIKILSFVQQAHDDPKRVLKLGGLFALGILTSFWILGGIAVASKAAAGGATWGTQFSNPNFVIVMAAVLFVFGVSLFGVFEINLPGVAAGSLSSASQKEGYAGSFVKGMLATVLATPCTAPLLGPAIAVAFTQTGTVIMLAMTAIGLGMGLPYVILAYKPSWLGFLPKPGPWMDTFKQLTGFLLMGVVIWLLWVLGALVGQSGVVATVAFLTLLGLACWMYGLIKMTWTVTGRLVGVAATLAIALGGGWFAYGYMYTGPEQAPQVLLAEGQMPLLPEAADWEDKTPWIHHQPGLDKMLASAGHTVLVNYTATWCTECQIQKKTVLETQAIRRHMRELGVVPLKADWTRKPTWITKELKKYGRPGVPLNVILPAGRPDEPIIVPLHFSKADLEKLLNDAGPSAAETSPRVARAGLTP